MRRAAIVISVVSLLVVAVPSFASASAPDSPSCWGAASASFGMSGVMGEHASQPPDVDLGLGRPGRAGIGNVARILGGSHPSDAAAALGFVCP
jgi:hypothetical protein